MYEPLATTGDHEELYSFLWLYAKASTPDRSTAKQPGSFLRWSHLLWFQVGLIDGSFREWLLLLLNYPLLCFVNCNYLWQVVLAAEAHATLPTSPIRT